MTVHPLQSRFRLLFYALLQIFQQQGNCVDSWVIVQGEVALTAIKNFPVVLESRGTMVVSRTGTSGQRDPHSSTKEMPTK